MNDIDRLKHGGWSGCSLGGWLERSCPLRMTPVNKCRRTPREKLQGVAPRWAITDSIENHRWMRKLLGKSFPERRYSWLFRVSIYGALTDYKRKMRLCHGETWRPPLDQVVQFGVRVQDDLTIGATSLDTGEKGVSHLWYACWKGLASMYSWGNRRLSARPASHGEIFLSGGLIIAKSRTI